MSITRWCANAALRTVRTLGGLGTAFVALSVVLGLVALALVAIDLRATPSPSSLPVTRTAEPQLSLGMFSNILGIGSAA